MPSYRVNELRVASKSTDPKAPLFVLLHGFGASIFTWRDITKPLSELGEVWAYDRPGFGFTERPRVWTGSNPYSVAGQLEFLTERVGELAKGRKVIVIGHSAGGQIATYFAARHSQMVSALVLISPAMIAAGVPEPFDKLFRNRAFDVFGPKLVKPFSKAGMKMLFTSVHDKSFLTQEVIEGYQAALADPNWTVGFWEFLKTPQPRDQHNAISEVTCPTLILTGDDDRLIATKGTIKLASEYINHKLVVIKDAGHLSHEEKPQEFMTIVKQNLPWLLSGNTAE